MGIFQKSAPSDPLRKEDQERVIAAIQKAESRTSGEIRVYMEKRCRFVSPLDRAQEVFGQLGMQHTELRNAVLIYIAWEDHQFALFGDEQAFSLAGGMAFWKEAADRLRSYLVKGEMALGLQACIEKIGDVLAHHFPYDPQKHRNELPDEIVFGR